LTVSAVFPKIPGQKISAAYSTRALTSATVSVRN
jgi:hypothetical protein